MADAIPFVFILGLIIGSFLNVVGLRWNSSRSLSGRSGCPHCGRQLSWYELVPVFSYVVQWGRCRGCKSQISIQYPLVELFTGLVFATIFNFQFSRLPDWGGQAILQTIILLTVFSIYIAITVYDLRHKIIPDSLVYSAIILSLGFGVYRFIWDLPARLPGGGGFGVWDFAAAGIIFLFFALVWLFSAGRAMGFGDAKLGLSIGLLLGAKIGFSAIVLAFWIGAITGLGLMVLSRLSSLFSRAKKLTIKSEIPFAPFLVLGAWLALIYDLNLLHIAQ